MFNSDGTNGNSNGNGNGYGWNKRRNRTNAFLAAFGLATNSPDGNSLDGNGPDGFGNIGIPNDEVTVQLVHHKWTLWNVLKAHESFIFVAILIVLGIGIFVSTFAQCLEYKSAEPKTYGHVIKFA